MATRLSNAMRTDMADVGVRRLDGGPGPATLEIRTGPPPATPDVTSGTRLAALTFSDPAFLPAVNGIATAAPITPDSAADATGTAGHFVVRQSDGTAEFTGAVGSDMVLVTPDLVAGQPVQIASFTFTVPAEP